MNYFSRKSVFYCMVCYEYNIMFLIDDQLLIHIQIFKFAVSQFYVYFTRIYLVFKYPENYSAWPKVRVSMLSFSQKIL